MIGRQVGKINGRRLLVKAFLFIMPALILFNPTIFAYEPFKPKNVLVLASYRPTSPVAYQWEQIL
jgi:uncharacterized membrane protein YjjB (DUF3815 family)